jgi:two-component system chemotaxis response regulator CheY
VARVLVVEDSGAMRSFIRAALEGADEEPPVSERDAGRGADRSDPRATVEIEVVEAASGFEALRLLPRGPYDLVITDINMPDINGLELVNFIRKSEHHRTTPLIIVSTQAGERDRLRGIALGADAFIAKPFDPDQLRDLVVAFLTRGRRGTPGRPSGPPTSSS